MPPPFKMNYMTEKRLQQYEKIIERRIIFTMEKMTQAERIREYFKENPTSKTEEAAEALETTNSNVKVNVYRDLKAGRCVLLDDKSLDYSPYFEKERETAELVNWKNDTRREWVDMLTRAAEKETDINTMRLLIKEANKLMKEVNK